MDGYSSGLRGLFAKQLEHEHVAQVRILYHPPICDCRTIGSMSDFQSEEAGSNPVNRSK